MARKYFTTITVLLCCLLLWQSTFCQDESTDDTPEAYENCDLFLENGICLYDGDTVLTPPPTIDHLMLFLTFDQRQNIDQSGRGNHARGPTTRGPGYFLSQGYSGHFQGEQNINVPTSSDINSAFEGEYSMSFWIFINSFGTLTTEQCNIIEKGNQHTSDFSFTIEMSSREILITVVTSAGEQTLTSNARLLSHRWTHISFFKTRRLLVLYVNGNLDAVLQIQAGAEISDGDLYLGRMPWQDYIGSGCTLNFYLDEFKFWDTVIEESYIEAESGLAVGAGIDPHSIQLGCVNCGINRASQSCTDEYHLCTTIELYSFAFSAAKSMGWARSGQRIWSDRAEEEDSSDLGLALCCRNY
ncbi:unnamed protein product [Moneuplotes crassus]|uniref:DUF8019 domain-containing protein n=1 Tax=Euplotes crassus TaxID=5936 RepID=A0AAD2CXH1_EUPCR|nr:unnamed protein product [Moneuplotes crassus]